MINIGRDPVDFAIERHGGSGGRHHAARHRKRLRAVEARARARQFCLAERRAARSATRPPIARSRLRPRTSRPPQPFPCKFKIPIKASPIRCNSWSSRPRPGRRHDSDHAIVAERDRNGHHRCGFEHRGIVRARERRESECDCRRSVCDGNEHVHARGRAGRAPAAGNGNGDRKYVRVFGERPRPVVRLHADGTELPPT